MKKVFQSLPAPRPTALRLAELDHSVALVDLEMKRLIKQLPGKMFVRNN